MQRKSEMSMIGAAAPLAALLAAVLIGGAFAGGVEPHHAGSQGCAPGEQTFVADKGAAGCVRISGYIAAGRDRDRGGVGAPILQPPSVLSGVAAYGQPMGNSPSRDPFFLRASHDDFSR